MGNMDHRSVQRILKAYDLYKGKIDGDWGPKSRAAARAWVKSRVKRYRNEWPDDRVRIAAEQLVLLDLQFYPSYVDGISGPATQAAMEKWHDYLDFQRPPLPEKEVDYQPPQWPRQLPRSELTRFYGEPGKNQTRVESPYQLYLDWDMSTKVGSFLCHEKVAHSVGRVLDRTLDHYGPERIHELGLDQFGGCLNVRPMRNGTTLSTHAWGIAIDWDADRNRLRETSRTARMARPEYEKFLDLWEEEGWVSLGRLRNYDWMHVQAARL